MSGVLDHRLHLEERCEVHQEKRTLVYVMMSSYSVRFVDSLKEHRNHTYRPIQEVTEELKVGLLYYGVECEYIGTIFIVTVMW